MAHGVPDRSGMKRRRSWKRAATCYAGIQRANNMNRGGSDRTQRVSIPVHLSHDALSLLRRFNAARSVRTDEYFCCEPIVGYAFAWILHPDLIDGARVAGDEMLTELEQAGLLLFDDDDGPTGTRSFTLTRAGIAQGDAA